MEFRCSKSTKARVDFLIPQKMLMSEIRSLHCGANVYRFIGSGVIAEYGKA
jgi:hypothetical protein